METMIPLPLIPQVDLTSKSIFAEGLTREQVLTLGLLYVAVQNDSVEGLIDFLKQYQELQIFVNATAISSLEQIVSILDAGARTVFVQTKQYVFNSQMEIV